MERERATEPEEREAAAVARGQNTLYLLPPDAASMRQVLGPALERVDREVPDVQVLVIAPDVEAAVAMARATAQVDAAAGIGVIPVTSVPRAVRLLRAGRPRAVVGAPADILDLIRASALKLEHVRALVLAWVDALLGTPGADALESVLAEIPKDAVRTLVVSRLTDAVEQFAERYVRRAGRLGATAAEADALPVEIRYVSTSSAGRASILRRLLDELDPETAAVYVRSDDGERDVREQLAALGYGEAGSVTVTRGAAVAGAGLVVLYELPASRGELHTVIGLRGGSEGPAVNVVALAPPRELGSLAWLAAGGRVSPLTLAGPGARARSREEALRRELATVLADGVPARELLALEPLLEEHDGVEIAAAALRLLERARERPSPKAREAAPPPEPAGWVRVFLSIGSRDNATPRDLVGAISGESGIRSDKIGKIELRESHTVVEIAPDAAEQVVKAMTGVTIRGRRVLARVDRDRDTREVRPRDARPRDAGPRDARPRDARPRERDSRERDSREGRPRDRDRPGGSFGRGPGTGRPRGRDAGPARRDDRGRARGD